MKSGSFRRKILVGLSSILFFWSPIDIFAQNQNLREYYWLTAKAEAQIHANKLDSAAYFYKEAFRHKEYPFFADIYNALLCELSLDELKDSTYADYFSQLVNMQLLDKREERLMKTLKARCDWKKYFSGVVDTLSPSFSEEYLFWKDILKRDQGIREEYRKKNGSIYTSESIPAIQEVDSLHVQKICEAVRNNPDILNERVAGYGSISRNFHVVALHAIRWGYFDRVQEELLDLVKKGILDARFYADIVDQNYIQTHFSDTADALVYGGPYGTKLLRVFCDEFPEDELLCSNCTKYVALFSFDTNNSDMLAMLDTVNSNRKSIHLDEVINTYAQNFLCMFKKDYIPTAKISIFCDRGEGRKHINSMLEKGIRLIYYIQNEHDFNF